MRAGGLDIGSRTTELVVLEGRSVVLSERIDTTPSVQSDCAGLLDKAACDRVLVTGYGRTLAEVALGARTVTEIKAYARGARALRSECRAVLDIGGQDMKAIALDGDGRILKFEMNDRCAAGAGKFLEMMAGALAYDLDEFGRAGLKGADRIKLSSMCAVFAESEVVGLLTRGESPEDIAQAVHQAIARRAATMLRSVGADGAIVFGGGAAHNPCLRACIAGLLGTEPWVPDDPQSVGALGAALLASEA